MTMFGAVNKGGAFSNAPLTVSNIIDAVLALAVAPPSCYPGCPDCSETRGEAVRDATSRVESTATLDFVKDIRGRDEA